MIMALKIYTVKTPLPPFSKIVRRNEFDGTVVRFYHLSRAHVTCGN
jgi:hypothetical protein